jgi:uncharacterized protein (TIGR03067 family)
MKLFVFVCTALLFIACSSGKKTTNENLNGNWIPVRQQMGGQDLPASFYAKLKLTIRNNTYLLTGETPDKGDCIYKNGKMDIYGKEGPNAGKHFMCIYKLNGDELTVCYNLKGDAYPTSFETKAGTMLFLSIYKKEQ